MKKRYILIIILLSLTLLVSCKEKISDSQKFIKEYPKTATYNSFVYTDINVINNIIENDTGIIYLGYPENEWCQEYVPILNEVADTEGLDKIYYGNILKDEKNNTEEYKRLRKNIKSQKDLKKVNIKVPLVIGVLDGEIVGIENETPDNFLIYKTYQDYFNEENISNLKLNLSGLVNKVRDDKCSDCEVKQTSS